MNYSRSENEKKRIVYKAKSRKLLNKGWLLCMRLATAVLIIGFFSVAGAVFGAYLGILENTPKIDYFSRTEGDFTSIVYLASTGEEIDRYDAGESREFAAFEDIPQYMKDAFVAIEDRRFYTHNGIDVQGMVRAVKVMLTSNDTEGASTITQQLIKNKLNLLRNTMETKLQEQYLAIKYEEALIEGLGSKKAAKDYILGLYLNDIGLGEGQIGVQAAALFYFGKDVSELTLSECAVIAATTQRPTHKYPLRHPENNKIRRDYVLDVMLEMETITQAEYDEAMADDPYSTITTVSVAAMEQPSYHSYYNDALFSSIQTALMEQKGLSRSEASDLIYRGGLSIYSVQDLAIQEIVDAAYMDESNFPANEYAISVEYKLSVLNNVTGEVSHYERNEKKNTFKTMEEVDAYVERVRNEVGGLEKVIISEQLLLTPEPQSAFVVIDNATGYVRAISGGRGEKLTDRGLNRAVQSVRQVGSVFKVIASYAPALDMGLITPATIIDDTPFTIGDYSPSNWDRNNPYKGLTTVREAIRDSMNICAVKNMYNTGVDNCLRYLKNLGITSLVNDDYNLSTALGGITYGVSPLELAAAYATIANEGYYNKPIFYTVVLDHNGNVLLENTIQPREVLKKTTAYLLIDMMKDVVRAGTGTAAAFREISMPLAGKTGTTTNDYDLAFVGMTPYYTASVWLGYDMQKTMNNYGSVHTKLWNKIMQEVHRDLPYKEFDVPSGLTTANICMESGMLAGELCKADPRGDRTRTETFVLGTQPTEVCTVHRGYDICSESMLLASPYCPAESVIRYVGIVRPVPYEEEDRWSVSDMQYEVSADILSGKVCNIHGGGALPPETGETPSTEAPYVPETEAPVNDPGYYPTDQPYVPDPEDGYGGD